MGPPPFSPQLLFLNPSTLSNPVHNMSSTRQSGISTSGAGVGVGLDLAQVNAREAAKLMSEEHKLLSFRPPPGSLAAQAQAAAARHPDAAGAVGGDVGALRRLARDDAARIQAERGATGRSVGVQAGGAGIGKELAAKIQSVEHKALGYRPPKNSLAAETQRAADKHPGATSGAVDSVALAAADVERILAERD